MEYTQEELQEMIHGNLPEVTEQEPVYAGFRPLVRVYRLASGLTVSERTAYQHPATADGWAAVESITLTASGDGQ